MAMGSYNLGATVRIPLQVTSGGIAETSSISPKIKSIIKPNGTAESDFPKDMSTINSSYGTYYYDYTPSDDGDYVVIITYTVGSQEYTTLEYFTVAVLNTVGIPRAEAL
jgi:cell division protein FtsI/penicillin-binding protein 2